MYSAVTTNRDHGFHILGHKRKETLACSGSLFFHAFFIWVGLKPRELPLQELLELYTSEEFLGLCKLTNFSQVRDTCLIVYTQVIKMCVKMFSHKSKVRSSE